VVAARIESARNRQRQRSVTEGWVGWNAHLEPPSIEAFCKLGSAPQNLLDRAFDKLGLSARAMHRVLKVARTIADLAGVEEIQTAHVAEAIQYRSLDRHFTV